MNRSNDHSLFIIHYSFFIRHVMARRKDGTGAVKRGWMNEHAIKLNKHFQGIFKNSTILENYLAVGLSGSYCL